MTPRLALPLLQAGQAQKEIFHNEALAMIDAALHPVAETLGDTIPPAAPTTSMAWIVGTGAGGAWSGQAHRLACWTGGGWRFSAMPEGALVWVRAEGVHARRTAEGWSLGEVAARTLRIGGIKVIGNQAPPIMTPSGGATVDAEARTALAAVLNMLRNHGLIAG